MLSLGTCLPHHLLPWPFQCWRLTWCPDCAGPWVVSAQEGRGCIPQPLSGYLGSGSIGCCFPQMASFTGVLCVHMHRVSPVAVGQLSGHSHYLPSLVSEVNTGTNLILEILCPLVPAGFTPVDSKIKELVAKERPLAPKNIYSVGPRWGAVD